MLGLCSHKHREICFEGGGCPVCAEVADLEDRLACSVTEVERLRVLLTLIATHTWHGGDQEATGRRIRDLIRKALGKET